MMARPKLSDIFAFEKQLMTISGFYLTSNSSFSGFQKVNAAVIMVLSVGLDVFMIVRMFFDRNDLNKIFQTLYYFTTQTAFILKVLVFVYKRPELDKMGRLLDDEVFNSYSDRQTKFINNSFWAYGIISRIYRWCCVFVNLLYFLFPLVDKLPVAVPAWFPVDDVKYRIWLNMYETTCFVINTYNNCTMDCITSALISSATAQLEILKDNLSRITDPEDEAGVSDEIIEGRLRRCIVHHNAILDFVRLIEDMFSPGVFFQVLSSIVSFTITGIMLMTIPKASMQFVSVTVYFLCVFSQLGTIFWFGHDILTKSAGVSDACYMSNWYLCNSKHLRTIFIIMERAKKPVYLTAGKFFNLSLVTFAAILRTAYSYFAVLQTVYGKSED